MEVLKMFYKTLCDPAHHSISDLFYYALSQLLHPGPPYDKGFILKW